ncbi:MAG: hypothetical protein H7X95_04210 [Deltaproteobacteria bacterium]|nr:hypothetical protein [Deltaproteobacteria bacterium]
MKETSSRATSKARVGFSLVAMLLTTGALGAQVAWAQVPPPAPPPVVDPATASAPVPVAAPMDPPPAVAPPVAPVPSAAEAAPKPPTAVESMPASRPDVLPPIQVGAWTRVSGAFQQGTPGGDQSEMNDWKMDSAYVELHAGGKIHKNVGVTLNLNSNMLTFPGATSAGSTVAIMDAIVQFDLMDELHIWAGHLLVPVDRANASGPFFMIPWNYPGFLSVGPTVVAGLPKEGPFGRNNGAVVWGDIMGGKLTYLAGVFDNGDITTSPLYSGRVRLALLDPEPGFWGNASYFGDKDLLSIGIGGQYQKNGSGLDKDWGEFNIDVLFEKKLGGGSFFTAEAAYYHFNVNEGALSISDSAYGLLAFATPTMGVGRIQPMVRYQFMKVKAPAGVDISNPWNIDVGLSYLIKGPALRLVANFNHTKISDALSANSIQLGAQAIFF